MDFSNCAAQENHATLQSLTREIYGALLSSSSSCTHQLYCIVKRGMGRMLWNGLLHTHTHTHASCFAVHVHLRLLITEHHHHPLTRVASRTSILRSILPIVRITHASHWTATRADTHCRHEPKHNTCQNSTCKGGIFLFCSQQQNLQQQNQNNNNNNNNDDDDDDDDTSYENNVYYCQELTVRLTLARKLHNAWGHLVCSFAIPTRVKSHDPHVQCMDCECINGCVCVWST